GVRLGWYGCDRYRSKRADESQDTPLDEVQLLLPADKRSSASIKRAVELGQRVAEATNWARDMVNEPAGVMTPTRLADEARKAADASGLKVSIGGREQIEKIKKGKFLGGAQCSAQKPKTI